MENLNIEDINLELIPPCVLQDVDKRISDWRSMGGKDSDAYIQNQLRYLKRVENAVNDIISGRRKQDEESKNN